MLSRKTGRIAHFMERGKTERHHGLGDKAGPFDRTGRRFKLDAVDPCGFDAETSDPLHKIIPFYVVDSDDVASYGLFYDNLAIGEVDFGATIDNYHGLFRSYRAEDGDIDYYFIAGPTMRDVVARYTWLTGGQHFPPLWSLGFGITSMSIADAPDADARVTAFIAKCREHAIPCDSFHFGSGYSSINNRRYCFNWNHDKFPDPAATMRRLTEAGMRPVANLKPCLLDDHPKLADAMAKDVLVKDGETGKPAIAQFWDGLGFHLDFTNPAGIEYAQTWSGDNYTDWKTLRWNLRQGLSMSVSGLFNIGHDVGGFHGPSPEPELLCRFVEFCALWPRFVMNSWKESGVVTLPWMYPEFLPQIAEAFALRYRLMPHIYAAMRKAAVAHVPPVRPLGMDFSGDARARRDDDCFLLGDGLLVAPVLDKAATTRSVYLPEHLHGWYDFHSGDWCVGGREIVVDAPLGRIPLFAAGGSMIALSDKLDGLDPARNMVRRLRVYAPRAAGVSTAELYDDDGITPDWNRGAGRLLSLELHTDDQGRSVLSATGSGHYRPAYGRVKVEPVNGAVTLAADAEALLTL